MEKFKKVLNRIALSFKKLTPWSMGIYWIVGIVTGVISFNITGKHIESTFTNLHWEVVMVSLWAWVASAITMGFLMLVGLYKYEKTGVFNKGSYNGLDLLILGSLSFIISFLSTSFLELWTK